MSINFLPDMKGYTGQKPFRFWCQTVLPLVYDDSLSYYELLNKVVFYLNNAISDVSAVEDNVTALLEAYKDLEDYVDNYFSSLDYQTEIDNKLDEMAADGSLNAIIAPVIATNVTEWLSTHISPTTPAVDSSLLVEDAAADAKVTGTAIYGSRDRSIINHTVAIGYVRYTTSGITDIAELMPWTYTQTTGSYMQELLGESFEWDLVSAGQYFAFRLGAFSTQNTTSMFFVTDLTGAEVYVGYCTSGSGTPSDITWYRYLNTPDKTLTQADRAADAGTVGTVIQDRTKMYRYCYTVFQYLDGWWTGTGGLQNQYYHSQFLRVNPGERVYLGFVNVTNYVGGFFDANKEWIEPIKGASMTNPNTFVYEYALPDIDPNHGGTYDTLYYMDIPSNCYYVSLNLSTQANRQYKQSLSNFPCFPYYTATDLLLPDKPFYGSKKLCIIGPSSVTIDNMYVGTLTQYLKGFQNYVAPYFGEVKNVGVDGGTWFKREARNIYDDIVTAEYDLGDNDVYMLLGSQNNITYADVGDADDSDPTTYFGGLNGVIDYIVSNSTNYPKFYLVDLVHRGSYYTNSDSYRTVFDDINQKYRQLADIRAAELIEASKETDMNADSYAYFTYDNTHFNQIGSQMFGNYIARKVK